MTELDTTPAPDDLPRRGTGRRSRSRRTSHPPTLDAGSGARDPEVESRARRRPPSGEAELRARPRPSRTPDPERPVAEPEPPTTPRRRPLAEPAPEPVVDAGPRTVGRFIADALRAAGVRYAFTVPGESFLGLLDALEGAGIRVVATRHEGGAAFMAEAHGQLTGRPAVCLGTRAVGGTNLAIGIHTARQDSTPMFVLIGQVERPSAAARRSRRSTRSATLGGLAKWAAEPRDGGRRRRRHGRGQSARPSAADPDRSLLSLAEDLLDEEMPEDVAARRRAARDRASDATRRSGRSSSSSPRPSGR